MEDRRVRSLWGGLVLAMLLAFGLAGPGPAAAAESEGESPGAASESAAGAEAPAEDSFESDEFDDPWENYNRAIFAFNDGLNRMVAEPVSRAWRWTFPDFARRAMRNFFVNIAFPIRVVNTTLQLKPLATGQEIFRFAVNSTFGLAGIMDPATHGWNMPLHREDFGQTLGYWRVPEGPYFMLPIFGPSTIRDTVGLAGDITVGAVTFNVIGVSVPFFATFAAQAGNFINSQSFVVDEIDRERRNSLDFYAAVRSAYLQFRRARVADHDKDDDPAESRDNLYYFENEPGQLDDDFYEIDYDDEPAAAQETP